MQKMAGRIIDTHVHIGGKILDFDMSEAMVEKLLNFYGIDYIILSNCDCVEVDHQQRPIPREFQISQTAGLQRTIEFAKRHREKVGVAPFIKPATEGLTDAFREMIIKHREMIKAIKIHPYHSNISPADDRCLPYWELARELDIPVVSHTGGCEAAMSYHLLKAARMFPEVKFVMVHMDLGTDHKEALNVLGQSENIYGDTTWVPMETTIEAIKRYGIHRIMFGSDAPIDGADTYVHNKTGERSMYQPYFYELPGLIDQEAYECLMWKNAVKLFHLELS